jgi:hypothetical protein
VQRLRLVRALGDFVPEPLAQLAHSLGGGILEVGNVILVRAARFVVASAPVLSLFFDNRDDVLLEGVQRLGALFLLRLERILKRPDARDCEFLGVQTHSLRLQILRDVVLLDRGPELAHRVVSRFGVRLDVLVRLLARHGLGVDGRAQGRERHPELGSNLLHARDVSLRQILGGDAKLALDHLPRARDFAHGDVHLRLQRLRLHQRRGGVVVHLLL